MLVFKGRHRVFFEDNFVNIVLKLLLIISTKLFNEFFQFKKKRVMQL
jgi:hypothetical protein